MQLKKLICLIAYYKLRQVSSGFNKSYDKWARSIRRGICRPIFDSCGTKFNVERGARFATGAV